MDSGSNLRKKAFLWLEMKQCKKKKKKKMKANRRNGDAFTNDPSMVIFVFFKN